MWNYITDATAYITGGSSGIGLAIARELRVRGASLVLIARNRQRLLNARRQLLALDVPARLAKSPRSRPRVEIVALDVTQPQQVKLTLDSAVARLGAPDIVVNSAGTALPGYFEQMDVTTLDQTLRVNLYGAWNTIQVLLPHLRQRRGQIVNVASFSGLVGSFGYTAYAASKFALVGFSEALRNELQADGITVSVLCPPDTDTPQLHAENELKPRETAELSRSARVLQPDVVAKYCLRGMRRRRFIIVPGRQARMIYLLKRLMPALLYQLMDGTVRRCRRSTDSQQS